MKQIFSGGFGGCGSRVFIEILQKAGYYVGEPYINRMYDFIGFKEPLDKQSTSQWFVPAFNDFYLNGNPNKLKTLLNTWLSDKNSFVIKHGHLMFIMNELKEWYPDSKNLYVMRHPIDNALNQYDTHVMYGNLEMPKVPKNSKLKSIDIMKNLDLHTEEQIMDRIQWYVDQTRIFIKTADYVVKLEDLCYNGEETLKNLFEFAEIDDMNYKPYLDLVKIPASIGRGNQYYDRFDLSDIGY